MLDLLKKIGVPATVAAVIATLVTVVPFLFKIDERYAKEEDLKAQVAKLEAANNDLRKELAQLVGFQQAMVSLIQQGKTAKPVSYELDEVGGFMRVQLKIEEKPKDVKEPAPAASAASAPAPAPAVTQLRRNSELEKLEKPRSWKELSDGLARQQMRLIKD